METPKEVFYPLLNAIAMNKRIKTIELQTKHLHAKEASLLKNLVFNNLGGSKLDVVFGWQSEKLKTPELIVRKVRTNPDSLLDFDMVIRDIFNSWIEKRGSMVEKIILDELSRKNWII
ncbi:hypothetical protein HK098_000392 [Nowakowskiella sp. JEL0407]|nr:hypothetical protein HK098_000392 [Nowakowskiella sp. JEL0407]